KVHGSLARAGKVRGQTPKVAKQDKKKKPRGRAYKRMQYNRRFVTAAKCNVTTDLSVSYFICNIYVVDNRFVRHFQKVRFNEMFIPVFHPEILHIEHVMDCFIGLVFAVVGFGKKRGPNSSEK
ncbi:hypothetical protein Goshw_014062, partial [Gossypium schwendimanii]|nr:hypothetical protein [Gossypium schwendimanii]